MENWTDYTDALVAEDSDALAAVAEILPNLPDPDDDPDGGAAPAALPVPSEQERAAAMVANMLAAPWFPEW